MSRSSAVLALGASLCAALAQAQQANVNLDWNPQKNSEGLVPFGANVISPEVRDDRTVTFRVKAPTANEVALAPSGLTLQLSGAAKAMPFTKGEDGVWTLTVGPLRPNLYLYRILIDGAAVADPSNTLGSLSDQPPQSQLLVYGDGPAYYDARNVPHGAVTRHVYHSRVTDGEREMWVYTPPGYDRGKTYPVLYLLGGSGELAATWVFDGRADLIMDNLLAEGKAAPMIIAMPNNQMLHRRHPQHSERTFTLFEAELRREIVPFVERNYRVQADRHGRALAGLSMGGRHAQLVGFKCLDLFASFGILSAGDPESEKSVPEFLNDPQINKKVDYLLVGLGTLENTPTNRSVVFHEILQKHKVDHEYYYGGDGGHDWTTWRHLLSAKLLPGLWRRR